MNGAKSQRKIKNIGFAATRLAGTDGVSLEAAKWGDVFEAERFNVFSFAGELDRPPERSCLSVEANFRHPDIRDIHRRCFCVTVRERATTNKINVIKEKLKDDLYECIKKFDIQLLDFNRSNTCLTNLICTIGLASSI